MPDNVDKLFEIMQANGAANDRNKFRKVFLTPGNKGYKIRKDIYDGLRADGIIDSPTYEDFRRKLRLGGTPTVNKYRQQMFNSVDPNKSRASELTRRAVSQAKRGMNNVRKPVTAKVVDKKGKPTGEEFAITPAKTIEDLDREYAQEVTKNWENELHDQMADADKDAAKISDMFKSFIGSTDEVGSVWGNMARGGGIAGTPHSVTTNNGILENTKVRQLLAARDYNRKRKELLQLEQDSRNGAIFDNHSFFRGMYDAAKDTGFLTGGASDLINAGSLLATKQDLDNGIHTEAGDMLMQQAVKNSDAQSQYGDNKGWMYTGGVITTNMAPFMVQIGSAGFSKGMSNAIGKVVQGAASKVALGTMEKATGMAGAHIANYIGKVTGLTTKAFGKAIQYGIVGAAQANTVGLGNVANDVINRYTGQVYQDEQGNYKFGTFDSDGKLVHEGGEDFLTALVKGEAAQTIEFATELAGGGIDAAGTALKNFVTKGGKKIINKYNMENVSKVIDFLLNNKVSKNARYLKAGADRTLGKVELNSIVGESLEEELGIIANTVFTGDNKISDLWDEKQQSQIWGGMLLSIGLMKGAVAPFHAYNAKQYYTYKHKLDKADVNLSQLLGKEKWEELRNQIDATTNEDMPEMVNRINRDVALGKNRQPVREYIQNLLIMRGYDIGNMLSAKKAVEDKGEGVSVKNMEKNQAYQQGRDAYGYDTHEIQLDQEDKQKSLAQLLGISEQQLASMSDEELESFSGRDDNIDRAIYDYQLSSARYEGVVDNARDQIDLEVQRAAQAVDMYTDKSRNTIRNATIKASGGLEDYGVYIISGNIATHDDGSIDVSNSDDMILYYDPTTNTVEHADAMMFAELGSEENADEVRSQAMADAKEKAIKETTGIIDGVVEVGTQFKTVDADGTEHTYEVLADNGDGTAMITIDGNIPTELVKGENVQVPVSFEELQKMKDASDQQRLQAAKAQREQMEKERAEQQMQAQTTQAENPSQEDNIQPAPIEDNLDYSDIIREDGKVQMVDVSDKDGNNLFPDAKDVFYIQGNKMRTKFAYIDANGELKTQSFPTGLVKIKTRGEVSVDDYKKYRNTILAAESSAAPETSMIEDNSGTIEADRGGIEVDDNTQPLSEADADNVIAQMESSAEIVPELELTPDNWAAEFGEDGIVSTPIGDVKMGENQVAKLFEKGRSKEFGMIKPTLTNPDVIIEVPSHSADGNEERSSSYLFIKTFLGKNGKKVYYFKSVTIKKDGLEISISSHYDRAKRVKEALMKGKLLYRKNDGAQTEQNQPSASVTTSQEDAAGSSESKDTNISSNGNENNESLTFEDGTPIPVDENGETDLSQTDAAHAAEWYDTNLGEDADDYLDGEIKKAKKVLEQAKNKKLAGTKPSELVASKKEKEAAIADAQAHYDSAISIRDSLKERRIAKEENTAEGRKNLIEKARRKFARLKSSVKDDAEEVPQLYRDTVGSLLHRLYDSTGVDVFDDTTNTVDEYVAANVAPYSLNYEGNENSKGVQQETGLSRSDFAKLGWLAKDGKGTTIDAMVHHLWDNRPSNLENADTQEIRNALLGLITSGQTAFESRNYIQNQRIDQAEKALEEQQRQEENAAYAERQRTENTNEQEDAPEVAEQTKFPDKLKEGSETIEVPEDATDENPLGLQLGKDKVPFEINGEKSGETYDINDKEDRKRLVAENSVDDKDILDIDMPKHVHKAIKELCKKMGLKVQFLYMGARLNGWIENGTMYLALDANKATQFVFGHEMTHAIKQKNPDAYKELVKVAMAVTTKKKFEEDLAKVYRIYHNASGYNNIDDFVEEVIADNIGKFISDHDLAQRFVLRLNHPVLATILHAIHKIKGLLYGDPYKSVDALERIVEKAYVDTANGQITNSETGEDVSFSLRQKPEPKKKGVGYKVFVLKDGKLYPPMVANPDGAATPVGVWLDADAAPIAGESKTGRPQVKQGGKGTQGGSGKLAYRPGWHLGVVPYAIQFNRKDADGNKTLFPKNFVFAEVEYAADVDYQEEARQEGINPSGKYQHSLAGLKHLPTDGYYMYRTNPNPETDPWVITGAMKVNRILTRAEQAELVKNAGREPQQIQEGDIVTDDVVNSINQEIANAPKFSLKVYHGSGADFTEFDFDHMGEGEGSQVFGWGGYVTSSPKIGKYYAESGRKDKYFVYNGEKLDWRHMSATLSGIVGMDGVSKADNFLVNVDRMGVEKAKQKLKDSIDEYQKLYKENQGDFYKKQIDVMKKLLDLNLSVETPKTSLYEVDIPDDNGSNYLDWDKPLSKEQQNAIREGLEYLGVDIKKLESKGQSLERTGENVYNSTLYIGLTGTEYDLPERTKGISKFLSSVGFTGIKYKAGRNFGGAKKGDTNYVIFKPDDMKITEHTKFSLRLKSAIDETETNPSDAQKESGNYKKGHIKFGGYDYTIENPKGSTRSGKDADGKEWKVTMHDTYGYIRGKFGKDGDHLDMFINDKADLDNWNGDVFVVDQVNPNGSFDEHKVMYGYDSMDDAKKSYLANYSKGWKGLGNITGASKDEFDKWLDASNRKLKPFADYAKVKFSLKDNQGNPLNQDGTLKLDKIKSVDELTDEDFLHPTRNVELPSLPNKIADAIGTEGKPVVIKKNIFERNYMRHKDVTPELSKVIFKSALYNPDLYGQNQKKTRPYNWVLINTKDEKGNNRTVLLEVNPNKDNVEIVHWHFVDERGLEKIKKQADREDGQLLILPSDKEEVGALSDPTVNLSAAKIDNSSETTKENGEKFSLKDDEYLKAVENGDMEKAQKMVNEAAEAAGYSTDSSYQGTSAFNGSAPWGNGYFLTKEERKEAWDNDEYDGDQTLGDYIHRGIDAMNLDFIALDPRNYRAADPMRKEAIDNVRNAIQKKSETITMYRSVPSDVKEGSFRNGDWVTPSRAYAVDNAKVHGWGDNFNIIEQKVPVDEIWWDGNDIAEWGYGREEDYVNDTDFAYKNTKNNRKLLDAVTYDDNGNVIPLSQRFNENNADVRYSLKDEKTMFGMHNISLDKLRKAIKQGGFAAPSMGVIDSKNGIYSGYGEITLIPKAEKIAKRTGKNIGTYAADAWTPIYPPVEKKFGGNGGDVAYDDIESVPKEMQSLTRNAINSFMDGRDTNSLAYLYLHEKGKAPELVHVEGKYPKELHDEVKGILGKLDSIYSTTDEQKEKLLDLFIREVYDGNREEFDNDIKNFIKKDEEFIKKRPNSNIAKNKQLDVDWMKEHGYDYGALSRFVDGILRDAETSGKVDENATMKAAQQYIQDNGMKEDFDSWKEKLNDRYNVEEVIFAGYKPDGNRKYLPNTVENAVKVMKQDGKNASVGSASFSHFVASILKPMGTLDQIRKKKGNLTGNYEDVEKFQEKWQPVYDELADKMQPDAEPFESYGMDRLEDAATQKNPKKYAKDEYGVDLTDEDIDKLNELIDAVKNEKPSIYFETKFMRPYGLDEFEKAIVPNDTPSDVVDALKKAGIDVSSYERGNAEDRQKVTMDAINSSDNIRFSLKAMMEKPEGWKQANKKAIHIAEAIERDPKFSLKNLDGTLIKAGTYFSGGGLVEEGLKGIIDPVIAVEYDEKISGVYRNNFGQHIVTADVRDVDPKELVKQIDGEVEYFHASPVCKNYSQAKSNHAEVELDKETAASTAEFINTVKPKVVTIENVKGYKDSEAMKIITDALDANGYAWDADVYNAADYGGYTNRERLIVRAVRDGKLPAKPKKMARKSGWYEAVADIIPTLTEKKNGVAPWMDIRLKADGIDWRNIDKPLYVMGSAYTDGKIPHAFADELLPTLRTKSGDVIVMPDGKVYRAMGRVLARVSGVSDDYKMPFSENLSHTIIGNGIPTQLTEHVIAPLLQNTLRPTTPEDGNTKFSLRGSTPYGKQMEEWMEKNHLEKGAVPMEKPVMEEGENIFDYANRMVEWTRNQNLWKTAPKQTGFQDALDKWKADNGLSPDAYPPVRPHRENYLTEIGYTEDLEEYNKKKELWKSAPKPKDFDLSVDLEDMNKQLRNIRRAVLNQKNYDQRTVKAVSDLVRKMLNIGWGDGLSRGKVGNLLSAAKNATGANDVKKYLDKAMGILAENYLNRLSTAYDNLINTKGARADQSGVIKMGSLDANGQAFMSEYKKAINMDDSSLNTYIANIEEDSAKNEDNVEMNDYRLAGIQAAIMFNQQIGGNDADIAELQRQIGELKNKKDATKEDKDLLKSLVKKLFENKFDRITMYENLLNNIQRMVKESKGRAKEFREEIAEHKNEILHRANLDLEGLDSTYYDTTTAKKKFVNNVFQRAAFSSTYTFEQFLKFFGKKAANGEGYLYNYFTKLNQDALDEEQLYNEMNRNALDEKTKELFGKKKFMKLVGIDGNGMKEMDIEVTDYSNKKTGKRTIHLKQGQMLYIYLVNKETDGEMKLRAMGITEEDVAAIEENLDPRVKAMGEWLQDEYLPECQRRYQATHTKYFGAPMKEVENYFPLAINNRARNVKEDVNQDSDAMSQLAGTSTGAIVTRRVNVIPLDIENADAFEVAFNHLQEMEEWSAMLPFRQDVNTLLSYTHFRNQVQNMSSVAYGSGKTLWDEFKQTAQIAAGTYKQKVNAGMMDSRIAAAMGGVAVAKISGRLWTAIKQSQSATVFLPECDFTRFVKNGVNPYGSWKWAKENIPDFRKRIENITYGDVKLRQYLDELEKYHDWTKVISKLGMAPNILVDGITCAVGARSVYETEVNRLTKLGYPKEKADEKAYYKAVAAYNKTQQSSGGMYLSPMQVDRTYVSAALSLFKNANFAYGRMQIEACRGLARTYDFWGGKHKTALIESMTRQIMEEDGLDENTARAIAKATYNRTFRQSIGRLINFATLVPVSWALYKVLPYLLTGDDDDKKKNMIEEAVLKGFATSLSDNYVIPFASNILNAGLKVEDGKPTFDPEVFRYQNLYINPATSDLANIYSMIGNQKWYSVANKFGMLGVQSLIGFNPETVGSLYQAFAEADKDNGNTAKEWQIGILKAISAPEESIRELYMDELGLKSGDIKKIPLAELEKRYAERQINRDNLLSQIFMDAESFNGYVDKYQKSFEKKIKDKMDKWDEYDKKKADEFFDTTTDPKLKDMIAKKRVKDANAAADEQIAKEGLSKEKKGKEPYETAYDAVKMSIDVAEDNAISTYNKVLNKRYAALNDEYNNQTDAMKYIFMSNHPNFKAYKDIESEYTNYGKKMKELKEKLVSADGYDAKQTILKQIRTEREKFSELQSKVR